MKSASPRFRLASALVAAIVAGCGGGSDGGQSSPVFDVQAAISTMFETAATYDMIGNLSAAETKSTAVELHETDTFIPGLPADPQIGDYPATQLIRKADAVSVPVGATAPRSGSETYYYSTNPFRLVARRQDNFLGRYTVTADLPISAAIGQSGQFATFNIDQSAGADFVAWSVEAAEVPGMAWVCLVHGARQITLSQCVRVGANGAILGARVHNEGPLLGLTVDLRSTLP